MLKEEIKNIQIENDRRVVYLTLTVQGEDFFYRTEEKINCLVEHFISQFAPSEIEQFLEIYEKLNKVLIDIKENPMG